MVEITFSNGVKELFDPESIFEVVEMFSDDPKLGYLQINNQPPLFGQIRHSPAKLLTPTTNVLLHGQPVSVKSVVVPKR